MSLIWEVHLYCERDGCPGSTKALARSSAGGVCGGLWSTGGVSIDVFAFEPGWVECSGRHRCPVHANDFHQGGYQGTTHIVPCIPKEPKPPGT